MAEGAQQCRGFKTACYAYPCSVKNGTAINDLVEITKRWHTAGYMKGDYAEQILHDIFGDYSEVKGKRISNMTWVQVYGHCIGKCLSDKNLSGIIAKDVTKMGLDWELFNNLSVTDLTPSSQVIKENDNTQVAHICTFLQSQPKENEVKILCLIGHGITESLADTLQRYSPEYRTLKSFCWKWEFTGCDHKHGLGKTAYDVCANARKGDIVAFSAGLITPEWLVEQLRKREENTFYGHIPFTLVLLLDSCYSGVWTHRIKRDLELDNSSFKSTRLIIQTACSSNEESHGQHFIPLWCKLQDKGYAGISTTRAKLVAWAIFLIVFLIGFMTLGFIVTLCLLLPFLYIIFLFLPGPQSSQTPTFYDSEPSRKLPGGLKFFTTPEQFYWMNFMHKYPVRGLSRSEVLELALRQ